MWIRFPIERRPPDMVRPSVSGLDLPSIQAKVGAALIKKSSSCFVSSVKNLLLQIDDFSLYDCEDEAIFAHLERIESKYKQTKALLNLKLAKFPKPPSKDLTF